MNSQRSFGRVVAAVGLFLATLPGGAVAQELIHYLEGSDLGDGFGRAAEVGDLTGDGTPDLVMLHDLGPQLGRLLFLSGVDLSPFGEMVGPQFDAGARVQELGDFDGDGFEDVLLGQFIEVPSNDDDGLVQIISGAARQVIAEYRGTEGVGQWLGRRLAMVGDVDQDGYADALFVGDFGPAQLRFGPDGSRQRLHATFGGRLSVGGVGDVDGDGHPDYAVGSPHFNSPADINVGAIDVYSGVDGSLLHRFVGEERKDYLGVASAPAGDVDGDGYGDILVGAPGGDEALDSTDGGLARIYSGCDGSTLWEERTVGSFTNYGLGVFGGRDFTGDGVEDWIVGDARVGSGTGTLHFYNGADRSLLWRRHGGDFGAFFRMDVFFADDMNGDGITDVGYGEPSTDPGGIIAAGILWVLAGAPGAASAYCTTNPSSIGRRAKIGLEGPVSVGYNQLALEVEDAVPGTFGLFFYGTEPRQTAFGDGIRCVGGSTQRLFPPALIDAAGGVQRALDFTQPPLAPGGASAIDAGTTRYFQFWFRDPQGPGGSGFNLSDGLEVLFTP